MRLLLQANGSDLVGTQVVSLQDINKRLQEYNSSLQMYNSKLQTDAAAAAEAMSKIQKEKSVMMETLSNLRGNSIALQEQVNQTKVNHNFLCFNLYKPD